MNKKNIILIVSFSAVLFLISFITGYKIMNYRVKQEPLALNKDIENNGNLDLEILMEEETISPNTNIVLKTYYNACKHTIVNFKSADDKIINMTKEQYEKYITENYLILK